MRKGGLPRSWVLPAALILTSPVLCADEPGRDVRVQIVEQMRGVELRGDGQVRLVDFQEDDGDDPDAPNAAAVRVMILEEEALLARQAQRQLETLTGQLQSLLETKIGALEKSYGLTAAQQSKLRLAGRGDSQRYLDEYRQSQAAEMRLVLGIPNDAGPDQRIRVLRMQQLPGRAPKPYTAAFDEGSLFAKALRRTLSSEQSVRHDLFHEIEAAGGWLEFEPASPQTVRTVRLGASSFGDRGLARLAGLKSVSVLSLDATRITDAGLAHLKGLAGLTVLELGGTQITDAGLGALAGLTELETLDLAGTCVSDTGLEHLAGLTKLKRLNLDGTRVFDAGLRHLTILRALEFLSLAHTDLTDAGLASLDPQGLSELRVLSLVRTQITDAGLIHLCGLDRLENLALTGTPVTDAGLVHLTGLTSLERLVLRDTQITDAGLALIARLEKLQFLDLVGTRVTDEGLLQLGCLENLKTLDVRGTEVTDTVAELLSRTHPELTVVR